MRPRQTTGMALDRSVMRMAPGGRMWSEAPLLDLNNRQRMLRGIGRPAESVLPTSYDIYQGTYTGNSHTPGDTTWEWRVGTNYVNNLMIGFVLASNDGALSEPAGTTLVDSGSYNSLQWKLWYYMSPQDWPPNMTGTCDSSLTDLYGMRISLRDTTTLRPVVQDVQYVTGTSMTLASGTGNNPWAIVGVLATATNFTPTFTPNNTGIAWTYYDWRYDTGSYMTATGAPVFDPYPNCTVSYGSSRDMVGIALSME